MISKTTTVPAENVALWQAMLGLPQSASLAAAERWFAALSPALVADLVPALAIPAETVHKSRLFGRYQQALQLQALGWIAEAGIDFVAIKGFAAAHLYYPTPASRLIGDVDILVREANVAALVETLQRRGFRFGSVLENPWGFLSDASFMPLHSADGNCNIDIHVQPDSYPLPLGLDTEAVFAEARAVMAGSQAVAVPSAQHMVLIAVSNFAKDKFAPNGLRKLLDLARLLQSERDLPWPHLIATARRARLSKALETTCGLLRGLGTPSSLVPASLGHARPAAIARLLQHWGAQDEPSLLQRLAREWRLAAEPDVAARLMLRRGLGLFRARGGLPRHLT